MPATGSSGLRQVDTTAPWLVLILLAAFALLSGGCGGSSASVTGVTGFSLGPGNTGDLPPGSSRLSLTLPVLVEGGTCFGFTPNPVDHVATRYLRYALVISVFVRAKRVPAGQACAGVATQFPFIVRLPAAIGWRAVVDGSFNYNTQRPGSIRVPAAASDLEHAAAAIYGTPGFSRRAVPRH